MLWRMRGEDSRAVAREHVGGVEAIERDAWTRCGAEAAALADGEQPRVCEVRNARDRTFSGVHRADRGDRVCRGIARTAQVQGMQTVRDHEAGAARACLAGRLQAPVGARYPQHLHTTQRDLSREVMTFLGSALWVSGWVVWGQTQTFWRLSLSMAPVSWVRTSENGSSTLRCGICGTVFRHKHQTPTNNSKK